MANRRAEADRVIAYYDGLKAAIRAEGRAAVEREIARLGGIDLPLPLGNRLIHVVTGLGRREEVELLLDAGADPSETLAIATRNGHTELVGYLLDRLAVPVDAPVDGERGRTLLMSAAALGRAETVELLLSRGADPDARNAHGKNPAEMATWANHDAIAKRLLAAGAAVTTPRLEQLAAAETVPTTEEAPAEGSTSVLPAGSWVPQPGVLTAYVFENEHVGLSPTLFFDIVFPLAPFEYDGQVRRTEVRLDFIRVDVRDWRELAGREFSFPVNPNDGYIDGSVCLEGHNPADVTRICFGAMEDERVAVTLDIAIDFTLEGPAGLGVHRAEWTVELAIDPTSLDKAFAEARRVGAL